MNSSRGFTSATALATAVIALVTMTGCGPERSQPSTPSAASPAAVPAASASAATARSATTAPPVKKVDGACAATPGPRPAARVTRVKLGHAVAGYGREGDTERLPLAIAARPGGSWLAWLGTNGRVHLGKLDCADKLVGEPASFAGIDLQDVQADATGGVLLLTRKGTCGAGPLCGGSSSPCNTMHMIRFDNSGAQQWQRQVTNLSGGRDGYDDGARFVWWYQHHGRLATDGKNYAAYFGVAITVRNGDGGKARLAHFTGGAAKKTVTTSAATSHPHLVGYGTDRMLLTWQQGSGMAARVFDASSGAAVGGKFTIPVPDHDFQAFKAYPDGSAAYPAAGGDSTSVRVARVLPMS